MTITVGVKDADVLFTPQVPDSHLVLSCSAGAIGGVASAANYCLPVVKPQRSAEGDSRQYRHTCRECLKAP
ncbi:hypothetical protein KC19_10G073200 [Ceratodon purpureus]|uniref:Uncharacterized protein n=1 Tax=Ceratodon purpureus TaxID=3225 RepID=A0A8T0GJ46_CERPU|nr:hypothetical protein KC19_10G073200 [Ceratodon purpureus]